MEHILALQALEIDTTDALATAIEYCIDIHGISTLSVACCGWTYAVN